MGNYSFWSDPNLEPKRAYRWVMRLGGIPQWLIKKTSKPSFKVSETPHKYINHTFYYPGRVEWDQVELTLVDPLTPDASMTILNIIQNSGYHFPKDPNDTSTISKARAVGALGNVVIEQLDPDGGVADQWTLKYAWISNVKMGDLDYEGDNMVEISLTLRFDYAEFLTYGEPIAPANV